MSQQSIPLALTFDDVLLVPGASEVLPSEVTLQTRLTNAIDLYRALGGGLLSGDAVAKPVS